MTMQQAIGWMIVSSACIGPPAVQAQTTVTVPVEVAAAGYADMIVYNGKVMTMDDRSTAPTPGTIAEAMAVRGTEILALGTDDEIRRLAGPDTRQIDLKGRTVIPGIVDPHTHIHTRATNYWMNQNPELVQGKVRNFRVQGDTPEELRRGIQVLLRERVSQLEPGEWVFISMPSEQQGVGEGDGIRFLANRGITRKELDELAPDNPVQLSGHPSHLINTAAQKAAGEFYRGELGDFFVDETGYMTDTLWIPRAATVETYFRDKTDALAEIIRAGMEKQAAVGITAYASHLMGIKTMDAIMRLNRQGRMPIRYGYTLSNGFPANPDPTAFYLRLGDMAGLGDDYFWNSGMGVISVDSGPPRICSTIEFPGSVGDFFDWCNNRPGRPHSEMIRTSIKMGQRVAIGHMYGDRALDFFMDDIEWAMKQNPEITLDYVRSRRFSSDHTGFYPRPEQLPRMAKLGLYISAGAPSERMFPWLEKIGWDKYANWLSPARSMIDAGVRVVFETERSVDSGSGPTYFDGGMALMTRMTPEGRPIGPKEAVDRVTLMKMSTSWPSEFVMRDKRIGTLEPGKLADFLILNKDYFTVPLREIPTVFPLMTVVGGKLIVLRQELAPELGLAPVGPQIKWRPSSNWLPPAK